ncbi:RNA polymerase sigma factor [Solibacillus sp. MA9]|uniref:RNA polymerase sigma factor n=2 Tax=Solibacillus palustris TaxID=2908203 RepID=A0ABS9UAC4_9BACL|nr:RNA polymerase sigma factor [Solibacillus sp. MA9]
MKIARNIVYDHFRRKKVLKFIPFLQEHEQIDYTYAPEKWLESKDSQHQLYKALGQLPHQYREAIVLRKIEGFSIKESAEILGWNEAKVRNATERGIKKLQQLLGGDEDA